MRPITRARLLHRVWLHPRDGAAYGAILEFLASRTGGPLAGGEIGTICAFVKNGAVVAAVLFHNWQPQAGVIEISAASDDKRWLSRAALLDLFGYAFDQMGAQAVMARMDAANPVTRVFSAYGFKRYEIPRLRGKNKAEVVMVLGDDEWKANGFHKEN